MRLSVLAAGLIVLGFVHGASAFYLDDAHRFDVRVRAYAQLGIMTEDSEKAGCPTDAQLAAAKAIPDRTQRLTALGKLLATCPPSYSAGDLAQERNFYNPEFDANLTDFMKWSGADEFKFRFAWWGFYDGIYDYLNPEWNNHRREAMTRFSQTHDVAGQSFTFSDENKNPRHIYGSRNRINELYIDYSNGPLFLRVGRQAISWGESDTIALLDVSNPFDLTLGAPGFFQDVEEARIPLYTVRGTYKLIEHWKELTSVFADVYLVPGPIDTTVSINPITAGVSPFNPDQADPNWNVQAQGVGNVIHTVLVDKLPANTWANSRWGARLEGVLLHDYTVQGWFLRTFNQQPAPLITNASAFTLATKGLGTQVDDRGFKTPICTNHRTPAGRYCGVMAPAVTILDRGLESVVGAAATWYSQPVNGIVKFEAEYFIDEKATIPEQNLNPRVQLPKSLRKLVGDTKNYSNSIPTADYVRWVVGYDRNFFVPALNPTNSFLAVLSYNSFFNVSEKGGLDYRNGTTKPGHPQTRLGPIAGVPGCQGKQSFSNPLCIHIDPHDYVDAYQYDGFLQAAFRTDYVHGTLEPGLTFIADVNGYFGVQPSISYRISDNLLVSATYSMIAGSYTAGLGTFRSHDILQLRVTTQLN
jgi:uncharacterized protein DUF1302